jgi:hypothetical protein
MKRKGTILGVLVASVLLAGMAVAAPNSHSIDWWVMAGGGGSGPSGSTFLNGTIGQWLVGSGTSGGSQLGSGFWGGGELAYSQGYLLYLPLLLRGTP